MALSWYQCKNCGTAIKKDSSPSSSGCSAKTFHCGQNLRRLATLITVVKSVARQFRQNHPRAVLVVRVRPFTLGQNFKELSGGGEATTAFIYH